MNKEHNQPKIPAQEVTEMYRINSYQRNDVMGQRQFVVRTEKHCNPAPPACHACIGCVVIRDFKAIDSSSVLLLYHISNMIQISNLQDGSSPEQVKALQDAVGLK